MSYAPTGPGGDAVVSPRTGKPAAFSAQPNAKSDYDQENGYDKDFLLEMIIYDLLWSALHVGMLATLLNACVRANTNLALKPWRHLLHDNSKAMLLALRYAPEIGLTPELSTNTAKAYSAISAAKNQFKLMIDPTRSSYSVDEHRRAKAASAAWARLAANTKSILSAFETAVLHRFDDILMQDARTLVQFLDEAIAGGSKRVSPSGEIALPALKQMRREPRLQIDGQCTLQLEDKLLNAVLKDVSALGLGIVCDQKLRERTALTIILEDGRQLRAKVSRQHGNITGLVFERKLTRDDPLLRRRVYAEGVQRS